MGISYEISYDVFTYVSFLCLFFYHMTFKLIFMTMKFKSFPAKTLSYHGQRDDVILRKHTYSNNIFKILPPETEKFYIKNDIFHTSVPKIDCEYSL